MLVFLPLIAPLADTPLAAADWNGRDLRSTPAEVALCVLAEGSLSLGARAVAVGATGAGESLDLQPDARVAGNVRVGGDAKLSERARVDGDLSAAGSVTLGRDASVTGAIREGVDVSLPEVPTRAILFDQTDVTVPPDQRLELVAGAYGDVLVESRAVLVIEGHYELRELVVAPGARVVVPPGRSADVNVVNVKFADRSTLEADDPSQVRLYTNAFVSEVGHDARVTATLLAPAATLRVLSRGRVNGCVGAQHIALEPGAGIDSQNPLAGLSLGP